MDETEPATSRRGLEGAGASTRASASPQAASGSGTGASAGAAAVAGAGASHDAAAGTGASASPGAAAGAGTSSSREAAGTGTGARAEAAIGTGTGAKAEAATSTGTAESAETGGGGESSRPTALPAWLRSAAVWVGVALAIVALVVLGVALLPGWWASLVSGWVVGVEDRGVVLGLALGAAFTLLPLAVALLAFRSGLTPRTRLVLVVLALLLLLPNVLTISVALAGSEATAVLAIGAPSFRGATVVGIGATVLVIVVVLVARWWSRRTRRTITDARERAVEVGRERAAERAAAGLDPDVPAPDPDTPALDPDTRAPDAHTVALDPDAPAPDPATLSRGTAASASDPDAAPPDPNAPSPDPERGYTVVAPEATVREQRATVVDPGLALGDPDRPHDPGSHGR